MPIKGLIMARNSENFSLLWNDDGSGANANVQFWKVKPPSGFLPLGDVAEASESDWIYNSTTPRGQILVVSNDGTPALLANPTGFKKVWSDKGSGAKLNGALWEMIPPVGYVAVGYCCTFSSSGDPPAPDTRDYYCVSSTLVTAGQLGPQIWDDSGSGADADVGIWAPVASSPVAFAPVGTFLVAGHDPSTMAASVLLPTALTF